ncbi:sensor histidine kinase [Devosia sp. A16]|uniref:sensor histidine kinase n=1 Tax=Devosia sp. A16 TaxID=1736675 RepID=UPI0006D82E6B|nr:PAS domain-containing sensor histidine kinase [Devosia sp. A16]
MQAEWIKSPTARLVLVHWADARPAWLWSQDGETLLWRNDAARYFHGKIKKHGLKLAPEAVPIKGQIARLIRLGSMGRASLSRIQFLAGERPISTTCTCTPLELAGGDTGLLIVGVDPIEPELLEAHDPLRVDAVTAGLLPEGAEFLLVSEDGQIAGGSRHALEHYGPIIESEGLPAEGADAIELAGQPLQLTRFKASPHDAMLLLFEPRSGTPAAAPQIADIRADEGIVALEDAFPLPAPGVPEPEPLLPMGLPPLERADDEPAIAEEDNWVEPIPAAPEVPGTLASLFDRLADDGGLYTALNPGDEHFAGPPPAIVEQPLVPELIETEVAPAPELPDEPIAAAVPAVPQLDVIAALIDFAEEEESLAGSETVEEPQAAPPTVWRVIGRGFAAIDQDQPAEPPPPELPAADDEAAEAAAAIPDAETVERVSRYNFDELSRILTDRVSAHPVAPPADEPAAPPAAANDGALINLTGETFILNRLPLGILVFRDQQVLFANRALTDLTGYESVESLRAAGLTAIFPSEDAASAGPVTQLVRRDGSLASVNARLQSITWQGRPALMLSASVAENRIGHEAAVRTFAELAAETGDDGFLAADRSGTITSVSLHGRIILRQAEDDTVGKPLASLIEPSQLGDLKRFLERPARFAETARPAITFVGTAPNTRITLFAEGQAGIVAGYYGFIRKMAGAASVAPAAPSRSDDVEPSMLTRISRGVRRPLNTVIGFADLIRSAAFGSIENQRYLEYAQDIKTAGQEIATLVDELDDYTRLREGRYPAQANDIDLVTLLESCLMRVRGQAGEARVLVRNAVSERLPRITADTASLTQAILNLLASAIDQTPVGGSVILSAQQEDDGAVIVNVRDGGEARHDLGERFVVFRDGVGKDGEALQPVRSSVGLALTRSLLAVNALQLSVDPAVGVGTMFSLLIPADLVREIGQ